MTEHERVDFRHSRFARWLRIAGWIFLCFGLAVLGILLLVWNITYHPAPVEPVKVHSSKDASPMPSGHEFSVLNWNVQYMAGKNHVFFYDLLDGSGPDIRPKRVDIEATLLEVARVIRETRPDFVLIQELDDGSKRTDGEDQLARLLKLLGPEYHNHASAWYWKAAFVPHPKVWGKVGMKLSILSRWKLSSGTRYQLPLMPDWWLVQQFNFKRAVLEVRVPLSEGGELALLTTHMDAFAQGNDTMERQVQKILQILGKLDRKKIPWIIAGDFNLLPDRAAFDRLPAEQQAYYKPETELRRLREQYESIPSDGDTGGGDPQRWYTHYPNDPAVAGPDRTIDYFFLSPGIEVLEKSVLRENTLHISDHLPMWARFRLTK